MTNKPGFNALLFKEEYYIVKLNRIKLGSLLVVNANHALIFFSISKNKDIL